MDLSSIQLGYTIVGGVLGGGIAWGGVLASVRGLKETAAEVKADLKIHTAADQLVQQKLLEDISSVKESVARIEGALGVDRK